MGYIISIGEYTTYEYRDNGETFSRATVFTAPATDPAGYGNSSESSYTNWLGFVNEAGLSDFIYNDETGLIHEHPGCVDITPEHLKELERLREAFYTNNPVLRNPDNGHYTTERLEWLYFWMNWAVENCKRPVFVNQ